MTGLLANRMSRTAFTAAGCYNLAFGAWAAIWPHSFFELFGLAAPRYPQIWACLGMVVGVYGLLYLHAAWKLETAWPIIAVGLVGKVLGPIGMIDAFGDDWPQRLGMLCIFNDIIWWLPFTLFLVRGTALGRGLVRSAPWLCVATHFLGAVAAIFFLRHGMMTQADAAARATYVANHPVAWSIGWATWMLSAVCFVGFCAWWGGHLTVGATESSEFGHLPAQTEARHRVRAALITVAILLAGFGTVFDFTGEGLLILLAPQHVASDAALPAAQSAAWHDAAFESLGRQFTILSAGVANLLYTVAGIILTQLTSKLPTWVRRSMWITWAAGIGMTIAAILDSVTGLVVSSIVLFPLMIVWIAWMGARWRGP